ncbi:EAL domain-containing protein [Aquihabitans sp. G128]|uniref:putative bifunctional diguanylate cyclase/phosphodiesterase n=1 Tax=Aquihabitans sp. G128 TaxID=2849779 RepID=UPI001C2331CD|nr:EAL domain-containing protein [Aquihabitans sp. G128]QXC62361.1 EAL domain-containing protein [Aquihabitans sp. G128]
MRTAFGAALPLPIAVDGHHDLTEEQADTLAVRRIRVSWLLAPLANVLHLASIVVTGVFLLPAGTGWFAPAWTIAMSAVALNSIRVWLPRALGPISPAEATNRGLQLESLTFAVLYALVIWRAVPLVSHDQAVLLVATFAGVFGSGAICQSSDTSLGLTWVWGHTVTCGVAFLSLRQPIYDLVTLQLVVYALALTLAIVQLSNTFERWCRAEITADAERSVVRLLLDDYEGGARDWLWQTDGAGTLVSVSARFARSAGRPIAAIEGQRLLDLLAALAPPSPDGAAVGEPSPIDRLAAALRGRTPFRDVVVPVSVEGATAWWSLSGHPAEGDGRAGGGGWRGVASNVTQDHEQQRQILRLATIDPLTGLANRNRFRTALDELVSQRAPERQIVLAFLDLDDFKAVNDTLGHVAGDELLAAAAVRLRSAAGPQHLCARLGGDEFAVLVSVPMDDPGVHDHLEGLVAALRQPFTVAGLQVAIRGSLGYAAIPSDAHGPDDLVVHADLALYEAKAQGRDTLRRFEPALAARAQRRAVVLQDLDGALEHDELRVWFQPQVDLRTGAATGAEALLRWEHPERGLLAPGEFIAVAEETGLIVPIGELALRRSLEVATSWPTALRLAVNVSPKQLTSPDFVRRFLAAVDRSGIDPQRVEVEVTETAVVEPAARGVLTELRHHGLGLAVDDFGTGYSSLATLGELPVTVLKIDRAFVAALQPDPGHASQVLVQAIIDVAAALEIATVAEGVETEEQADILRSLGCPTAQGFLWSPALPAEQVEPLLSGRAGPDLGRRRVERR